MRGVSREQQLSPGLTNWTVSFSSGSAKVKLRQISGAGSLGSSEAHTFPKTKNKRKSVPGEGRTDGWTDGLGVDVDLSGLEEKGSRYLPEVLFCTFS